VGQFVTESNYTFDVFDHRARLLRAALGFSLVPPTEPELRLLHQWIDSLRGVGDVVTGMARRGYRLHLSNVDAGTWRRTLARDAMTAADGFGADATPWRAAQRGVRSGDDGWSAMMTSGVL
jgi:hypothetical protein